MSALAEVRGAAGSAPNAVKRALRGELDGLDAYFGVVLPCVFAAFYVFDKHPHRPLFYVLGLIPMLLYFRRPVIAAVSRLWVWRMAIALCGLWAASVLWSESATAESAFDALRTAGALAIFLTAGSAIAMRGHFPERAIVLAIAFTAGLCAVLTFVLQFLPGVDFLARHKLEGFGWADHSGNGGDIYGFAAVVAMVLAAEGRGRSATYALWAIFAVCLVYVVLTESRAPVLGIVVAAATLGLFRSPRALAGVGAAMVVTGLAVQLTGMVDFANWIERGSSMRFGLWTDALDGILAAPLFGAGAASTQLFHADGETLNSPHNGFIGMFFYLGSAGGVLLLALCAHVAWRAVRYVLAGGTALPLVTFVFGMTVVFFHTKSVVVLLNRDWLIFWLPVMLVLAIYTPEPRRPGSKIDDERQSGGANALAQDA